MSEKSQFADSVHPGWRYVTVMYIFVIKIETQVWNYHVRIYLYSTQAQLPRRLLHHGSWTCNPKGSNGSRQGICGMFWDLSEGTTFLCRSPKCWTTKCLNSNCRNKKVDVTKWSILTKPNLNLNYLGIPWPLRGHAPNPCRRLSGGVRKIRHFKVFFDSTYNLKFDIIT
jgi:hypothetical protein